jgi:hypothetical protein
VRAASGVRSFRRGSQDRAHDEAGPEVLKPGGWSLAWTSSTGAGAWRARQAGCGRRPVADHVVTAGVVPGALRHCLRGAGLRSGGWPGARYPGQLVLAGSPGRSVSRSPCRCWGMPGSARRRTGPCCGACPSSRIPAAGRPVCGVRPALSGVSALYCERNEAEEVSRPAMAIHPPTSSPKLAVLVPAAATWSGPRRCARFR